jgi:hypothetical protein
LLDVLCIFKVRSETETILQISGKYNIQEKIEGSLTCNEINTVAG